MTLTLQEIAALVNGTVLSGNSDTPIHGVASLVEALEGDLSFFANPKYLADLKATRASAVLVRPGTEAVNDCALVAVESPSLAFTAVLAKFRPQTRDWPAGIHPRAYVGEHCDVHPTASIQPHATIESGVKIGANSVIGANVYVGHESRIGEGCHLHPNVTVREHSQIGNRVVIHSGSVIGSDGYGYEVVAGRHQKIPQIGIVQLDDDVEIGSNTTIDRARFGRTWIGEGTKIDNLVQIAHNVVIGKHCLIIAQTGISGSTQLGNYVIVAGGAGIVGHIKIGDGAIIAAKAGISKDIPAGEKWMGYFAEPAREMAEKMAYLSRLPKLFARVKVLEKSR